MSYLYIFVTICLTVYCQLIVKWRINIHGDINMGLAGKYYYFLQVFTDPFIISGVISIIVAGLCWIAAMTKFDLSYAYPFVGLTFALVLIFSAIFFHEPINLYKIAGVIMIIAGIVVSSRGM